MNLNDLKNEILDEMPSGIPIPRIHNFLLLGFRDACRKTMAFNEAVSFHSVVDQRDYTLTPVTSNTKVCNIIRAHRATIPSPTVTLATSTSGGTLAAATYYYRVSVFDDSGETLASVEKSIATTGATSTVTMSWADIEGAKGYKVYGRTTGAELLLATYTLSSTSWDSDPVGDGTATSWTDDASLTPSGALPAGNINIRAMDAVNAGTLNEVSVAWRKNIDESTTLSGIRQFLYNGTNTVTLSRIPKVPDIGFRFQIVLYPTVSFGVTATLPEKFEQYREMLKNYALWKLCIPSGANKSAWQNTEKAIYHKSLYDRESSNLLISVMLEFGGSSRAYSTGRIGG